MKYHRPRCICLLLQVILGVTNCLAVNLTLNVNLKRQMSMTSGAFLSLSLDPATLLNTGAFTERSASIVRGLAPAYVRFGGPQSNFYSFERPHATDYVDTRDVLSETQWTMMQRWAENAGLDVIACVAPHYTGSERKTHRWDPANTAELLSFSDRMGYNSSWQLGYECQTRCELSGGDLGRYVASLRKVLDTFPRYTDSLITGPDIVAYKTARQQKYLRDYFESAGAALSVVTWHPELAGATLNGDSLSVQDDSTAREKNEMYKVIGHAVAEKPLWIAESGREEGKHQYLGALVWTRRLGDAAKLGAQVIMRQPSNLNEATPDYWVSLLHKTLVGREVLEVRVQPRHEGHVYFYSQCTKPSAAYERGAVTVFGVNLTPGNVTAGLKGLKVRTLHEYALSPDTAAAAGIMLSEKVLLNGRPLDLINGKRLPVISPRIVNDPDGVELNLASGGIGFWVIPNAKVKACMYHEEEEEEETTKSTATRKLSRRDENTHREVNRKEKQEGGDASQPNSINQKVHARQRRRQQNSGSQRIETRKGFPRDRLFDRLKKLSQRKLRRKKDSPYLRGTSANVTATGKNNLSEETKALEILNDKYYERVRDDKAVTNDDLLEALVKYENVILERKFNVSANGTELNKSEMRRIDSILTLISKIKASLQSDEKQVTTIGIRNNMVLTNETTVEERRKSQEQSDGLARKRRMSATEELEKYFGILYDLLEDYEPTRNYENNQISGHSASNRRSRRDLKQNVVAIRSKVEDLRSRLNQRIKLKNDRRGTSPSVPLPRHNDGSKHVARCLLRRNFSKSSAGSDVHSADPQHSGFGTQRHGRTTRDVDRRSTDLSPRRDGVFRKRTKTDEVRDSLNERKSRRKDDLKREGLLNLPNSRIARNDDSEFRGFAQRKPIEGFPEGDVYLSTGDSEEQGSQDYDYVEDDEDNENDEDDEDDADDEDNSRRKDSQKRRKDVASFEEDTKTVADMPNEFYENLKVSGAKVKETSRDYGDLWEAEFFIGKHDDKEAVDGNKATIASVKNQPLNGEESEQKPIDRRNASKKEKHDQSTRCETRGLDSESSTMSFHRFPDIPTAELVSADYRASSAEFDTTDSSVEPMPKTTTFAYQVIPTFDTTYENYGDHRTILYDNTEASRFFIPVVAQIDSPVDSKVLFNRRAKRNAWSKMQKLLSEEMIKEDANNDKDCRCRVIRTSRNSPRKLLYNSRTRRNADMSTEFADETTAEDVKLSELLTQLDRSVRIPKTKEEYDEIMTGEILPRTAIEADLESAERKTEVETAGASVTQRYEPNGIEPTTDNASSRSTTTGSKTGDISKHSRAAEKPDAEVSPPPADSVPGSSASRLEQAPRRTFFRDPPAENSTEIEETTYDSDAAGTEIFPSDNKSRPGHDASDIQDGAQTQQAEVACSRKQAQKLLAEEAQDDLIRSVDESRRTKEGKRNDNQNVNNSRDSVKRETEGITEDRAALRRIMPKHDTNETANRRTSSAKRKLREDGNNDGRPESKFAVRTRAKESNDYKRLSNALQNFSRTSWKDLVRYEEAIARRAERIKSLKEKLRTGREGPMRQDNQGAAKITGQEKRTLKRRAAWERFYDSEKFHQMLDQKKLVLVNDDMTYEDDDDDDDDDNDDDREDNVSNDHDDESDNYQLYRHPQTSKIEGAPASALPVRRLFVLDPSTYRGGEPILREEYSKISRYSPRHSPQPQLSKWLLEDFYRTLPRKFYGGRYQSTMSRDADHREAARRLSVDKQNSAVALYILDRPFHRPKELAGLSPLCRSVIDRRDVEKVEKDETTGESDENISNVEAKAMKSSISVDEERAETKKYMEDEEPADFVGDTKGGSSNKRENATAASVEGTGELSDSRDKIESNVNVNKEIRDAEEAVDNSESGKPEKGNVRARRNAERRAIEDEHLTKRTRLIREEVGRSDADHDDGRVTTEGNFERAVPLLWLTKFPSSSVPLRESRSFASISSSEDLEHERRKKRRQSQQPSYVVLVPEEEDEYVDSHETSKLSDLETSLENLKMSKWFDRYLLKRLTDTFAKYLFDELSYERDYENLSGLLYNSAENTSEIRSGESSEDSREVAKSREGWKQYGRKRSQLYKHLKGRQHQQGRVDERRASESLSERDERSKRQRREIEYEVDKIQLRTRKSILDEEDVRDGTEGIYAKRSDDSKNEITKDDYPRSQRNRENRDDLLEDLLRFQTNKIISGKDERNDDSLENSISSSDKSLPFSVQEAILELQDAAVGGTEKAQDLTESTERIDNFKEELNETSATNVDTNAKSEASENVGNPFHVAIMKIRKFFTVFTGLSRVLRV